MQTLLETLVPDIIATNEPAHIDCGAPDYVITKKDIPLGYIEAKDLDDNLDDKSHKEQFDRYRNSLNNLIITNYLEFRFYRDGEQVTIVRIGHIENGKVVANTENFKTFNDLSKTLLVFLSLSFNGVFGFNECNLRCPIS